MTKRVLLLGPEQREAASRLAAFALTNVYVPGPGTTPPGDDPRHVLQLNDFRCVFSFTCVKDKFYRHLSVSVGDGSTLPNPHAFQEIARLLGFEGSIPDWQVGIMKTYVVVAQPMDHVPPPAVAEA